MKKRSLVATAVAGIFLIAPSQADLIDLGNVTRDTSSGIDWLDVTETDGMSYNQVTQQLGPGGAFEGYRYATLAELEGFLTAAGGTAPFLGNAQLPLGGWVTDLLNLWGVTAPNQPTSNQYTAVLWGESTVSTETEYEFDPEFKLVEVEVTAARVETGILQNFYGGGYATARFGVGQYNRQTVDYSNSVLGSALVKDAPPQTGYALWVAQNVPASRDTSFNGDWNADGVSNGISYVFGDTRIIPIGGNPAGTGRLPAPASIPPDVDLYLELSFGTQALDVWGPLVSWVNGAPPVFGFPGLTTIAGGEVTHTGNSSPFFYRYRVEQR